MLSFVIPAVHACPHSPSLWAKTYGGKFDDILQSAEPTPDGGVIVAGYNQPTANANFQYFVLKLDVNGNVVWQKTFGGGASSDDRLYSVRQTLDGGFILAGYMIVPGSTPGDTDIWLLKLDASGGITWQKKYGGPGGESNPVSVDMTSDGGFIVSSYTNSFGTSSGESWVLRLDAGGNVMWQKTYGGPGSDYPRSVKSTPDGGFVVVGTTTSFGADGFDMWVLRLDASGNVTWQKRYGGPGDDAANSVELTSDGFVVAGSSANSSYLEVLRLDANGNVVWQKGYSGGYVNIYRNPVKVTADGGFIVGGTNSFGAGDRDMWALRLDGSGNVLWQKTYGGAKRDQLYSVGPTSDGRFMVAGLSQSFTNDGNADFWVLMLDANGSLQAGCSTGTMSTAVATDTALLTRDTSAVPIDSSGTMTVTTETSLSGSAKVSIQC